MNRLLIALIVCITWAGGAFAQTTVNLSVTDTPDNQTWNNGTWQVQLIPQAGNLSQTNSFTLNSGGGSLANQSGSLSSTGTASFSLPANSNISPLTTWRFTVCSQQGTACSISNITVTTSSPQTVALTPPSIRVAALANLPPIVVYTTTEVASATIGSQITVVGTTPITPTLQSCTVVSGSACTTWAAAGGGAANAANPAIPGPPVFNVKNYGAKGNGQASINCTSSSTTLNCTDAQWTSANVGQNVSCSVTPYASIGVPSSTTFTAFIDATHMTLSAAANGTYQCVWGTPDDAAITTAAAAAVAAAVTISGSGNTSTPNGAAVLYFPAGQYVLRTNGINLFPSSGIAGIRVLGDGLDLSKVYLMAGTATTCGVVCTTGNDNWFNIENITLDGAGQAGSTFGAGAALWIAGNQSTLRNVMVERFSGKGIFLTSGVFGNHIISLGNQGDALTCQTCGGEFYESLFSNSSSGAGIILNNVVGLPFGAGFRLVNSLLDENTGGASGCNVQLINAHDVWFQGPAIFASSSSGACSVSVDGNSFLHWEGGLAGFFGSEFPRNGLVVSAGGIVQSSDVRYIGTGTGKCIQNSGIFNDNGGNTCETVYNIASGTSTGTTAVLTLTSNTVNVNTNCAVGDALEIQGAGIAGYNGYYPAGATSGITAVTASTLTYTTAGSNLGALGAGGVAACRNLITYSGNLPKALLNNPIPNTCYVTGAFAATTTAAPMCAFKLGSATNINQIKATSTTTTACTVAPVVTITDGTQTETLTITTAKSIWDSSVDASTGVGTTIFKPNGTITLSNTAGTCTTPPTNFSVSYNITPILSN